MNFFYKWSNCALYKRQFRAKDTNKLKIKYRKRYTMQIVTKRGEFILIGDKIDFK